MSFLSSKKHPFEKKKSWNDKNQRLFYRKVGSKEIWNFSPESWVSPFWNMQIYQLTLFEIFIVYKGSFWENNIIKRQNQGLFYRNVGSKDI